MKKKLLLSTLMLSLFTLATINETKAQASLTPSLGLIYIPGEDSEFGEVESVSLIGLNVAGKYNLTEKLRAGVNLGYFFKKEDEYTQFLTPITALVEYSFGTEGFCPYLGADLGLYRQGFSADGGSLTVTDFGLAPVAGFNFDLSDKMNLNVNTKYHYIMTEVEATGAIGVNAGLTFKF